jgi:hypothetical protein
VSLEPRVKIGNGRVTHGRKAAEARHLRHQITSLNPCFRNQN